LTAKLGPEFVRRIDIVEAENIVSGGNTSGVGRGKLRQQGDSGEE